jgi:N-formylglutamate deformylase
VTDPYRFQAGETPVLLSIPHVGAVVPADLRARMTQGALVDINADRHLDRLFQFAPALGAGWVVATHARAVADLNPPSHVHAPVPCAMPIVCSAESADWQKRLFDPYHTLIASELARVRDRFGIAVLLDVHAIAGDPSPGLSVLSIGTAGVTTCDSGLLRKVMGVLGAAEDLQIIHDGVPSQDFTIRRHAAPASGIHAVQLDIARDLFMDPCPPWRFRDDRAVTLRPPLERLLAAMIAWTWSRSNRRPASAVL